MLNVWNDFLEKFIIGGLVLARMKKEFSIGKDLEYQDHQRDYSLLGSSATIKGLFKDNANFFNAIPFPIFMFFENGVFHHYMSKHDGVSRCEGILKKGGFNWILGYKLDCDKKLREFKKLLETKKFGDLHKAAMKLYQYFVDFTPMIFVGFELPEYKELDKQTLDLCVEIRKHYEDAHKLCFEAEKKILSALEKERSLSEGTLRYLLIDELEAFLDNGSLPKNLGNRGTNFILKCTQSGFEEFYDKSLLKNFEERNLTSKIEGRVAFKGNVTGRVRVIKKISEAESFKKGEILVASMTDPRYVFIMEKAAAIVTDEGGMLCHAAIVSREFGIPCIVGTKIATKVLKDGDLVEVDAENGIVRKLE